jgi:hypothetical protein
MEVEDCVGDIPIFWLPHEQNQKWYDRELTYLELIQQSGSKFDDLYHKEINCIFSVILIEQYTIGFI